MNGSEQMRRWLRGLLGLGALSLPLSIPVAQFFLYASVLLWGGLLVYERRIPWPGRDLLVLGALAFSAMVLLSLFTGIRPEAGLRKIHRLLLLGLLGAVPAAWAARNTGRSTWALLVAALAAGCCLRAGYDLIRIPCVVYFQSVPLQDTGNMRDPQFYMVALLILLGAVQRPGLSKRQRIGLLVLLLLCAVALLLHGKRGAWMACGLAVVLFALHRRQYKLILFLVLAGLCSLSMPFVRERLAGVGDALNPTQGARGTLWVHVAPPLIRAHPWGMGFKATRYEDFRAVTDQHIEHDLDHLHNNVLQMIVELGWLGMIVWVLWMGGLLWMLYRVAHRLRCDRDPRAALAAGLAAGGVGLLLNGVFEYNFGDSEIFMLFLLYMGLARVMHLKTEA